MKWIRWWWFLFLIPVAAGLLRLHFDTEVLDLLPADVSAVQGLKIYQSHFSSARELIITVQAPDAAAAENAARSIAGQLRLQTNLVSSVTWQPPWEEYPRQTAALVAYLWLNQPPSTFTQLAQKLSETNLPNLLAGTRDQLATSLSPNQIARLSYDPLGLTQLPRQSGLPDFSSDRELFASSNGTFRVLFVRSRSSLENYRVATDWLRAVEKIAATAAPRGAEIHFTGRPAFVDEMSGAMKHDITFSIVATSGIIAVLFWLAHRRVKPMLWLLTLLALILATTLALGGLLFGAVNVISMGFAAILLGLAVDYAVVHYQEALAHPDWTIPEIRRDIAPAIFWAAITTMSAFLVLNFGGLPGLGQLGSLVAVGVGLAALVMIFAYLPPLFPHRMARPADAPPMAPADISSEPPFRTRRKIAVAATAALLFSCAAILCAGLPKLDPTANALQLRNSPATASLDSIQTNLNQPAQPLQLVIAGPDDAAVARKLDAIQPVLETAVSNRVLAGFNSPDSIWPRPSFEQTNRRVALQILARRKAIAAAVLANGFSRDSLGLTEKVFDTWQRAAAATNVFVPSNSLCNWIFQKVAARGANQVFAAAYLYPSASATDVSIRQLKSQLPRDGVWLSSWALLGQTVLKAVKSNLWKLLVPMVVLVLLSLWFAFRRFTEIALSLCALFLGGLCLLAVMRIFDWRWNLLNLMALPLVLGTGVDYGIFMQLALRRHGGDLRDAYRSVGRALLLCGGTAMAGFTSLGFSTNMGMSSLGRVCAVGIGGNMVIAVLLLPFWWKTFNPNPPPRSTRRDLSPRPNGPPNPPRIYSGWVWRLALLLASMVPAGLSRMLATFAAAASWRLARRRRQIVLQNLLPIVDGDHRAARRRARLLFSQFAIKMADLLRFEAGATQKKWFTGWQGWEHFHAAHDRGKGVLLVTPHLGNWEFGGAFLADHGFKLLVLTQPEPDPRLTALRQASRSRRGVETLVVGHHDAFAFVEVIKRLEAGAVVALLVDRPPAHAVVNVTLFGRDFPASIAAAELARASGCAILPCCILHGPDGYQAQVLPEIVYDRAAIGHRQERIQLTQRILQVFEPIIRKNAEQWYHFVPVWPRKTP
ncbi:MAG: MMPL family transporter [Verrucomicrobia bacterium]|nr:MMPL family transporter [Verrucomicrobiota bacterium]MDE3098166.1 MMPL family transporter [Verrucomicrobiota bacterium]